MDESSDVGRCRKDPGALGRLLTRHRDELKLWTERRVGVPPGRGKDASDVVQDAFTYVVGHIETFQGTTKAEFVAWLRSILRHQAIDVSRKRPLVPSGDLGPGDSDGAGPNGSFPVAADLSTASGQYLDKEKEALIKKAAPSLSDQQRQIVVRHEVYGVPLRDAAETAGLSPVEGARLFFEAVALLRETLAELAAGSTFDEGARRRAQLKRAVRNLPGGQREAVELKHYEQYSLKEIAEVLKCPSEAAVGALIYRGMKALKAALGE